MGTPQAQLEGDLSGLGSRKRGRNGGTSSASRRHIQTEQKRRDKINEGWARFPVCVVSEETKVVRECHTKPAFDLGRTCSACSRYQELQKLLGVENIEKAQLLMQAADYTRQLQVRLHPLPGSLKVYLLPCVAVGVSRPLQVTAGCCVFSLMQIKGKAGTNLCLG